MNGVDRKVLFERAVDLVINQDQNVHSWAGRYLAIQGGFATAVSAIIGWRGSTGTAAVTALLCLLAVLAIILAHVLTAILERELAWQGGYVKSVKLIEGAEAVVFRDGMLPDRRGMERHFRTATVAVTIAWAGFAMTMLALWIGSRGAPSSGTQRAAAGIRAAAGASASTGPSTSASGSPTSKP